MVCLDTNLHHCVSLRPVRQQDGVRDPGHWLAVAANLPQGDAEEDSSEHPGWVLPEGVCCSPLRHTKDCSGCTSAHPSYPPSSYPPSSFPFAPFCTSRGSEADIVSAHPKRHLLFLHCSCYLEFFTSPSHESAHPSITPSSPPPWMRPGQ